ncbi:hypothetical protein [uncultured Sphingomonas sp.]|uniref:hypothetical protein n=1 Tax=uncultured Sphingomonas sp. TaxID=158754 RepID=UPI0030F814B3
MFDHIRPVVASYTPKAGTAPRASAAISAASPGGCARLSSSALQIDSRLVALRSDSPHAVPPLPLTSTPIRVGSLMGMVVVSHRAMGRRRPKAPNPMYAAG